MLNRIVLETLEASKGFLLDQQKDIAKRLVEIRKQMPKKRVTEDYTIILQSRKKTGFVYCVRYYIDGKCLPTKYSLQTQDKEEAKRRAVEWREELLSTYGKQERRGNPFHTLLKHYYAPNSKLLAESLSTKRQLSDKMIKNYHSFINNYFIPFLKKEGINKVEQLKPQVVLKFKGWLRDTKGYTAKTINDKTAGAVKRALDYLYLVEKINYNPFRDISKGDITLSARKGEVRKRSIFPINRLFDVLISREMWVLAKNVRELANTDLLPLRQHKYRKHLVSLISATTGLRAGEVYMLKLSSIEKIGGMRFLNITNSHLDTDNPGVKTENAYRRVPLHRYVYESIMEYVSVMKVEGDYLFFSGKRKTQNGTFSMEAYRQCGIHCGYTETEMKEKKVDFHSFRHFYRTILSQGGVSVDLARYFMGHAKDMGDMSQRYNNMEEIGNDISDVGLLVENGKKVIDILNGHFNSAFSRQNDGDGKQIVRFEVKEVELTDPKNSKTAKHWTWVISGYENIVEYDDNDDFGGE